MLLSLDGQTKSNLQIMMDFSDSTALSLSEYLSAGDTISFKYQSRLDDNFFVSRILAGLSERGIKVVFDETKAASHLVYFLEDAGVEYSEVFKSGLLGDFVVGRKISYAGSFTLSDRNEILHAGKFLLEKSDSVEYDKIPLLENPSLSFTQTELPDEPFWASITEPLIAVGAIIVTVVLLFTIRSK